MIPISISPSTISGAGVSAESSKLIELLQAFLVLAPPERVIHVGTGSRPSETLCWRDWPLTEAIVIDAEEQDFEHIDAGLNPKTKISKHCAVLAETDGAVDYFVANNLSENGLVDPTLLRTVWPSLALSHRSKKDALTLDSLVEDKPLQSWLIIDCLPAVRILNGAIETLKDTALVCVRALAEPGFRGEPVGADIRSIDSWLDAQGFKRLAFVTGLNPKIGHVLYGRPLEKSLAPQELPFVKALLHDLEEKTAQNVKLTEDLGNAAAHRDTLAAQLITSTENLLVSEERSRQANEQLQARNAELNKDRARTEEIQATLADRNAALQAKSEELEAKTAQVAKLNEDLDHTAAHRDTLLAQLQTSTESLQTSEERVRQAVEQLQARSAELDQERSRIEQLHATLAERDAALQARAGEIENNSAQLTKLNEDLGNTAAHRDTLAAQLQTSLENLQASEERARQTEEQLQTRLAELESNAAQLTKLNEQLGHLSAERDSLVERFKSAQQNLQNSEQTIASLKSELETEVSRRERLTAENLELTHRQQMMNEELVKAEGQISLIKDLLLREQGL